MSQQRRITDDLEVLLNILPDSIVQAVHKANSYDKLLEIILDLGRVPTARYVDEETILREREISHEELDHVVERIGSFDADNRAGLERTLHRISAIRNRRGNVVGLTLRVGRAVYGTIDIIQDIIESGKSILILGRPGVGKTTLLREAARILAESRRVIIVDTSNEIGGDGDVPHPAVGKARRMQVKVPTHQHEVMIEAVENHNPEVIVIDEIGRELEAQAARTIAERGVQLIGTAHGKTLENLLLNPTLSDLVGGIEAVTLSDEEARRRGTQKTVLERRAPPTFDVLVEIQTRDQFAIHTDITEAVDTFLRGYPLPAELRIRDENGKIRVEKAPVAAPATGGRNEHGRSQRLTTGFENGPTPTRTRPSAVPVATAPAVVSSTESAPEAIIRTPLKVTKIYPYGVARNRLMQAAKRIGVPAVVVRTIDEADSLVTLRSYYRDHQATIVEAERRGMPIYVLRANSVSQIEQFLTDLYNISSGEAVIPPNLSDDVRSETQTAIAAVMNGERYVDMPPASPIIRRIQHEMAREAALVSHSYGKEPRRHVRIYRD
ncbi:MAG TPA: R3H domain-containing nucleic acid-binding protein [Anaerolineales bacterium]|jgi:stage III sporulation protein SpoIIIAA